MTVIIAICLGFLILGILLMLTGAFIFWYVGDDSLLVGSLCAVGFVLTIGFFIASIAATDARDHHNEHKFKNECTTKGGVPTRDFDTQEPICIGGK
jgi:hypothetical protein